MPELPEVETMVRDLNARVIGRTITEVRTPFTGTIRYPETREFVERVTGSTITSIWRRGKYAVFEVDSGDALIIHRGMTGSLLLRPGDAPLEPYVRLIFGLDDGTELRFDDARKLGKAFVMRSDGGERVMPWARMGPEPLSPSFTQAYLTSALAKRTAPIKSLLLNQEIVAGLGNIYVDETLFRARIHPRRPARSLAEDDVARLYASIRHTLASAVDGRGTTFSSYRDLEGRRGSFQDTLSVFRKGGEPCPTCGTPIDRIVVGGRGTHFCPVCQE